MEIGVPVELVRLFARLAKPSERSNAIRELRDRLGVEEVLIFIRDTEVRTFVLAQGFVRTLPEGQVWQKFLVECGADHRLRRELPFPTKEKNICATGLGWNEQIVLVLLGDVQGELELLIELLPSLAIALLAEHSAILHEGQAMVARELVQESTALAEGLDNARRAAQQEITARKKADQTVRLVSEELKRTNSELVQARDRAVAAGLAKDDFLAALSHELRTPLNPVLLVATEYAEKKDLSPEVRASFEMIAKNVSLEARLIDDLLDLTRITRGKMNFQTERVAIQGVLNDTLEILRAEVAEKKILLKCEYFADDPYVLGDPVRLHQILWNVIKNAVKFTPLGGNIWVTTFTLEPSTVRIEVRDSGIGLSGAEINRIFDAFSQGDHAAGRGSHQFGGLGLGLAISKYLTEMNGGRITATSGGPGLGSTFAVEFPLLDSASFPSPEIIPPRTEIVFHNAITSPGKLSKAKSSIRILLVEDHASSREAVKGLLMRRGYDVLAAGTATEARTMAEQGDFNLLISDLGLPDRDGYQLMSELRQLNPGLAGIALSGYGMEDDLAKGRAAGFASHLTKPISLDALDTAITALFPEGRADPKGAWRDS